ncbi:MAG: hypothetical protein ACP5Q4_07235 [Candidatus Caldatribacteriaceae bacterium]
MSHAKGIARLFALLVTWMVVTLYVVWGFLKNLSLFTIAWRILLLAFVVYTCIFYYALWIVSQKVTVEEGKIDHDEPDKEE